MPPASNALRRKQVVQSLSGLSAEERAEVVKWCDVLGVSGLSGAENPNTDISFTAFNRCFAAFYHTSQIASLTALARSRPKVYRKLITATNHAMARIEDWWPDEKKNVKVGLLNYLCRLSFQVATRRTVRVNWEAAITALSDLEATVNDAFPGWLSSSIFQSRALRLVKGSSDARPKSDSERTPRSIRKTRG